MVGKVPPLGGFLHGLQAGFGGGIRDRDQYAERIAAIAFGLRHLVHDMHLESVKFSGMAGDHVWMVTPLNFSRWMICRMTLARV